MGLQVGDSQSRIGVFTFADEVDHLFYLNDYNSTYEIVNALPPYYTRGKTNTAAALAYMRTMFAHKYGDRTHIKNIGVVLTDGRSDDERSTWIEAMKAREAGIHMMTVAVGDHVGERELRAIASHPAPGNMFSVGKFNELYTLRHNLLEAICNS